MSAEALLLDHLEILGASGPRPPAARNSVYTKLGSGSGPAARFEVTNCPGPLPCAVDRAPDPNQFSHIRERGTSD